MKQIFFASALFFTLNLEAQHSKTWEKGNTYSIIGFGVGFQDFNGLNNRLQGKSDYEQLNDVTAILHLGWLKERNRLVSNGQFNLGSTLSGDRDEKSSVVRFIGLSGDIGYDLLSSARMMLYPMVGLGYEWYQARFFKNISSIDFDDVLSSPAVQNAIKAVEFKNSFFAYRARIGFNILSPKSADYGIGIQAFYTGSFQSHSWKSNDQLNLENSPEDRLNRFHISLILSGRMTKSMHK